MLHRDLCHRLQGPARRVQVEGQTHARVLWTFAWSCVAGRMGSCMGARLISCMGSCMGSGWAAAWAADGQQHLVLVSCSEWPVTAAPVGQGLSPRGSGGLWPLQLDNRGPLLRGSGRM